MDREDHVRAVRRREGRDALTFEREREALLVEQLQELYAEIDGGRLDATLFAEMDPADAEIVRAALGHDTDSVEVDEEDEDGAGEQDDEQASERAAADELEAEVVRLRAEIETSRRAQAALARYLELLPEPPDDG